MATTIAVAISKGGVGKTTTAVNLAAEFGLNGYKVLLVDTDEQGNATFSATGQMKSEFEGKGLFEMLRGFEILHPSQFISPTTIPGVDIIPTNELTAQVISLLPILKAQYKYSESIYLAACLEKVKSDYDFIVIDTPPAKNALTLSALYASDHVIIPVKADKYCIDSLGETMAVIENLNRNEGTNINLLGILFTMIEKTTLTSVIMDSLSNSEYADKIFWIDIRKGQAVNESTAMGQPVVIYNKRSNPAQDYHELYKQVINKLSGKSYKGD